MKKERKWTPHIIAVSALVVFIVLGLACASTPSSSSSSSSRTTTVDRETQLRQAAEKAPNDAKAQYEWGYYLMYTKNNYVQAASVFERVLQIDPDYRVATELSYSPQTASNNGVAITSNLIISNFSLFNMLAAAYSSSAGTNTANPSYVVAEEDRYGAREKALDAFRRGYEIDITGGKNNNTNLKTVYLMRIAYTLNWLGRQDEAVQTYVELAKIAALTTDTAFRVASATRTGQSYYVSAQGNNSNNGLSESAPLRSLSLAYERARVGTVRRITVIGTLNAQSEGARSADSYVFNLEDPQGANTAEILITGKWGAASAVLSGTGSGKSVVMANGTVRFEYIEVSGGALNAEGKGGNGITVYKTATIGTGTVVRANKGAGVYNFLSTCTLAGGEIHSNENSGVDNMGTFNMRSGTIRNNKNAKSGGGVMNSIMNTFTMSGGSITANTAEEEGGGVANYGTFTMSGGSITGNSAKGHGGGVVVFIGLGDVVFTMTGGTISGNNSAQYGGGVYVVGVREEFAGSINGGIFRQSGGSITGNTARIAGGVHVGSFNGRYDKTGGTVSGNTTTHYLTSGTIAGYNDANLVRMQGSLGSGR